MKKFLILVICGYQKFVSPLLPRSCRYYPTCSQYMIEAIQMHGVLKGILMGIFRIFRCHPFVKGGIDNVPTHFSLRKNNKSIKD